MSNDSSPRARKPFTVTIDGSGSFKTVRFDPREWTYIARKDIQQGWLQCDELPEYFGLEELYFGKPGQWIAISFLNHTMADFIPEQVTGRLLIDDEAVEWLMDCEDDPPKQLSNLLLEKTLTPTNAEEHFLTASKATNENEGMPLAESVGEESHEKASVVATSNIEWAGPKSPSEWEKLFRVTWKTIKGKIHKGDIRGQQIDSKSWKIAKEDIPT